MEGLKGAEMGDKFGQSHFLVRGMDPVIVCFAEEHVPQHVVVAGTATASEAHVCLPVAAGGGQTELD